MRENSLVFLPVFQSNGMRKVKDCPVVLDSHLKRYFTVFTVHPGERGLSAYCVKVSTIMAEALEENRESKAQASILFLMQEGFIFLLP